MPESLQQIPNWVFFVAAAALLIVANAQVLLAKLPKPGNWLPKTQGPQELIAELEGKGCCSDFILAVIEADLSSEQAGHIWDFIQQRPDHEDSR